jgi:transposase
VGAPAQVVIGVDAHKRAHTLVAADELGRELVAKTLAATAEGHLAALAWASRWPSRRWALEDCRHLTRTLEPTSCAPASGSFGCRRR